jgi:sugar lactone lactonase YvrE
MARRRSRSVSSDETPVYFWAAGAMALALLALAGWRVYWEVPKPILHSSVGYAGARLSLVAHFADRQITGLAIAPNGRIFVNLPRWSDDVPISVAEVVGGKLRAYPDEEWNAWRNANELSAGDHFVCVQSVVFDSQGFLWAVDAAAPGMDKVVKGGAKLVQIDVAKNEIVRTIPLDESVAPAKSYLNDVRFNPDASRAYVTDSGMGAIIVVDLVSGRARRLLADDPRTQPEPDVKVHADGKELKTPDGRGLKVASDGIALSPDGDYLYWQALTGRTLYRVATRFLDDETVSPDQLRMRVETVGHTNVADGLWIDPEGSFFITAPEENAVKTLGGDGRLITLVQDSRLRWPNSFAQDVEGALYVTSSHIQDSPRFSPGVRSTPSEIWKIEAPGGSGTGETR